MTNILLSSIVVCFFGLVVGAVIGTNAWSRLAPVICRNVETWSTKVCAVDGALPMLLGVFVLGVLSVALFGSDEVSARELLTGALGAVVRFFWWIGTFSFASGFAYWFIQTRKRYQQQKTKANDKLIRNTSN